MAQHFWYCDGGRARTELGWEPRDPMETLDDTVAFLRERFLGGVPPAEKAPTFLETLVTRMSETEGGDPAAVRHGKSRKARRTTGSRA